MAVITQKEPKQISINQVFKTAEIEQKTPSDEWQNLINLDVKEEYSTLEALQMSDFSWRLKNREGFKVFLFRLLVGQNVAVFLLFGAGLYFDKLQGLETVFSVLVGGTLLETTSLIYIIVKWLFSEIPYENTRDII